MCFSHRLVLLLALSAPLSAFGGTFPDFGYTPPAGWMGPTFELSQDYPQVQPPADMAPWKAIDFKVQPQEYMAAVFQYAYEGNLEVDFVVQNNAVRKWYHAPWLHAGPNQREFVRGLTHERASRRSELAATQNQQFSNFAVGFYNPRGGFTIGQVWSNPMNPVTANVAFPEDTVTFKLLFTTATAAKVPFLAGSPEWAADINRSPDPATILQTKVRLLQVDIAVKDNRSLEGGWVFGTFQYDTAVAADSPWKQLRPLSLMWGNDPALKQSDFDAGQRPVESWINPDAPVVQYRSNPPAGVTPPRVMGWAGRANGPVDNSVSSCLSCHSTAQIPAASLIIPPANLSEAQKLRWFRNLAPGEPFDTASSTLDFSLQLGVGIQNQQEFHTVVNNLGGVRAADVRARKPLVPPSKSTYEAAPGRPAQQYRFTREPEGEPN